MGFTIKAMGLLLTIVVLVAWPLLGGNFINKNIPAKWLISQLTTQGYWFVGFCLLAFILNLLALIYDDRVNAGKDFDNTKTQKQMSDNIDDISKKLKDITSALEKSGYKYDSVKKVIIAPQTTQTITHGSGVQNTGTIKNSIVAGGNVTINNNGEKQLTEDAKVSLVNYIRRLMTRNDVDQVTFDLMSGSNLGSIKNQMKKAISESGVTNIGETLGSIWQPDFTVDGILLMIEKKGNQRGLTIVFGNMAGENFKVTFDTKSGIPVE
jgi:hypothetical protein